MREILYNYGTKCLKYDVVELFKIRIYNDIIKISIYNELFQKNDMAIINKRNCQTEIV